MFTLEAKKIDCSLLVRELSSKRGGIRNLENEAPKN